MKGAFSDVDWHPDNDNDIGWEFSRRQPEQRRYLVHYAYFVSLQKRKFQTSVGDAAFLGSIADQRLMRKHYRDRIT